MRTILKYASAGGFTPTPDPPLVLWTPANIGSDLALWVDASDATSVTLNSGVEQINDKSGNNRHATQATATSRPTYTTSGLNGRNVLTFDGVDDVLFYSNSLSLLQNVAYSGIWSVASVANTTGNKNLFFYATQASAISSLFSPFIANNSTTIGGRRLFGDSFAQIFSSVVTANNPFIYAGEIHWGAATAYLATNGNTPNSGAFSTAGNTQDLPTTFNPAMGATSGGTNFLSGFIGEQLILVSSTRPSSLTLDRISGYLAHKWGLSSLLPVNHPFKNAPPYQ